MLEMQDTDHVRAWLSTALTATKELGRSPMGLAAHCGVSRQAVNGWITTGRISKTNLSKAAEYFGSAPDFLSSSRTATEPAAAYRVNARPPWPFEQIDERLLCALPVTDLLRMEGALLALSAHLGIAKRKRRAA